MMFASPTSSCFQLRWTQWVVHNVDPLIQVHFHAGSLVLEGLMEARKVAYCHKKMLLLHILMYLAPLSNCFFRSTIQGTSPLAQTLCVFNRKQSEKNSWNFNQQLARLVQMFLHYGPKLRTISLAGNAGFITEESFSFWLVRRGSADFFKDMPRSY